MKYINVTVVHFTVQIINQTGINCNNWKSSNYIDQASGTFETSYVFLLNNNYWGSDGTIQGYSSNFF